jgi:hypothetical protein
VDKNDGVKNLFFLVKMDLVAYPEIVHIQGRTDVGLRPIIQEHDIYTYALTTSISWELLSQYTQTSATNKLHAIKKLDN